MAAGESAVTHFGFTSLSFFFFFCGGHASLVERWGRRQSNITNTALAPSFVSGCPIYQQVALGAEISTWQGLFWIRH